MKTYTLFAVLSLWLISNAIAQPYKQITIDDATQKRILTSYIDDADRKGSFVRDKGVVVVTRFIHDNGRPGWLIEIVLDDAYKDNPPVEWASLGMDVVLFYDARSSMHDVLKQMATPELLHCLDEAIGDRLYIRPPKRERLMTVPGPDGKPMKVSGRRLYGGNVSNSRIFIFEADGSITKLHPV